MNHLLWCSLINAVTAKERIHDRKFIKRYPTLPDIAPHVISSIAHGFIHCNIPSNFNIILLFQHKVVDQGSVNYSPQSNSGPASIFGNKVYWNIAMPICLHSVWGCLLHMMAELSSCDRDHMPHKPENSSHLALYRKCLLTFGLQCNFTLKKFILALKQNSKCFLKL